MVDRSERSGVEVLCVGTELLLGNILNGNARWLSEELASLGLPHVRQTVQHGSEQWRERVWMSVRAGRCNKNARPGVGQFFAAPCWG